MCWILDMAVGMSRMGVRAWIVLGGGGGGELGDEWVDGQDTTITYR
jgi:hypothetical protein